MKPFTRQGCAVLATLLLSAWPALAAHPSQSTIGTVQPSSGLTQWTPDGVATQIESTDPALLQTRSSVAPPPAVQPDPLLVQSVTHTADQILKALSDMTDANDTQYYKDGVWYFTPMVNCCDVGPAGLAAILWKYRQIHPDSMDDAAKARQSWLHQVAVDTFNHYIDVGHADTGRLANPGSHDVFYYIEFVRTYLVLQDSLDAATREKWLKMMRTEVTALQSSGDMPNPAKTGWLQTDGWYINGNVDLCHAAWIYFVWLATGDQQYKDYFETCWHHLLLPNQTRWKGCGLFYLKMPTRADGADGAAYITERNDNAPGFDKEYGMFQLGLAANLYLHSRDPRVLRVTNLLYNVLEPHLNKQTMILDAAYGSRHSCIRPLNSCGPEILTWLGGRGDFLPLSDHLQKALFPYMLAAATKNSNDPGFYRATGGELGTILEAAMVAESETKKK